MEYTISAKTFTSVWTPSWVNYVSPIEQNTFEIFSWEKIKNENRDTMNDYPTGYLVGLRHGLGNTTAKLFIHHDKNSMIYAYEDKSGYHQDVYIKPCLQSDFYGTWKMVDSMSEITLTKDAYIYTRMYENLPPESYNKKIFSWEIRINKDDNTKNDYPLGYRIKSNDDENRYEENIFYLHKNKNSVLWLYGWQSFFQEGIYVYPYKDILTRIK